MVEGWRDIVGCDDGLSDIVGCSDGSPSTTAKSFPLLTLGVGFIVSTSTDDGETLGVCVNVGLEEGRELGRGAMNIGEEGLDGLKGAEGLAGLEGDPNPSRNSSKSHVSMVYM